MDSIEAWREVHSQLLLSITLTKDSINCEKAKRRLLLEELHTHITPEGSSLWNKVNSSKKENVEKKKKTGGTNVRDCSIDTDTNRGGGDIKNEIKKNSSILKKRKSAPNKRKQQNGTDNTTRTDAPHSNEQVGCTDATIDVDQFHKLSPKNKKSKTEQTDRETIKTNDDSNDQSLNVSESYFPHSFSGSLQDQNDYPPASNNFFNYPIAYSVVEASAIDAAAAVASALTAQSLSSAKNNQLNSSFSNSTFQENQTSVSPRQGGFEEIDDEDDDTDG